MAGAGLVAIKRRIKSITSTQKITKAMGLIATSKLRKVRNKLELNDKYSKSFSAVMSEFVNGAEDKSIYIHGNKGRKKLYITLNSDSGLCGGFNANVVNKAAEVIVKDRENSLLLSVGQKGRMYFNRLNFQTTAEYVDIPDVPTLEESSAITYKVLDMYRKAEVGEVYIIYTRFHSTVKQVVTVEKILPLENKNSEVKRQFVKFEPSIDEMIDDVIVMQLKQQILNFMLHSKASEQGSRMSAMDGATKNANELLDALNLKYNRERQGAITQEISEIVGGAEAQK
ncbi:ATP synthase F1 subunit gamma [Clostridium thailandense]|uniref:ATP synthase gamma chain n=1 Tax=Clostridium thailandense TaxID=2794346 RepID=A0A949TN55_9CLOT|nr:ATP synthase F1 subunit gamma [Clostridium thailandense]MBV7272337.1 F0F1 ATP synthase subunit gamma [Clostridium thailandense]MCH5135950.1 F0F1 ATP synthase subunit gamma [Clostridiaceae bacterium UIB06]